MAATASTTTSSRRVRFTFAEARHTRDRSRRRESVAAFVEAGMNGEVISATCGRGLCTVVIVLPRRVSLAAATDFAKECPHYVKGSCELLEE